MHEGHEEHEEREYTFFPSCSSCPSWIIFFVWKFDLIGQSIALKLTHAAEVNQQAEAIVRHF